MSLYWHLTESDKPTYGTTKIEPALSGIVQELGEAGAPMLQGNALVIGQKLLDETCIMKYEVINIWMKVKCTKGKKV